jgi:predicted outer membrane protein
MKRMYLFSLATALLCCSSVTLAQTQAPQPNAGAQPQPQQQTQPAGERRFSYNAAEAGRRSSARSADSELAACLIVGNESEVFAGQLALQKSQNDEVKQFAQQMVDAHGQMIQKLQKFAPAVAASAPATNETPAEQRRTADANAINNQTAAAAVPSNNAPAARPNTQQGGPLDHVAFKRELGEMCKQTLQREWAQKSGAEFDKCYIGHQIGAHLHAIDVMKVSQNHSSDELRQALDEGIRTAESHLQHAKDLMKKLEGQTASAK